MHFLPVRQCGCGAALLSPSHESLVATRHSPSGAPPPLSSQAPSSPSQRRLSLFRASRRLALSPQFPFLPAPPTSWTPGRRVAAAPTSVAGSPPRRPAWSLLPRHRSPPPRRPPPHRPPPPRRPPPHRSLACRRPPIGRRLSAAPETTPTADCPTSSVHQCKSARSSGDGRPNKYRNKHSSKSKSQFGSWRRVIYSKF